MPRSDYSPSWADALAFKATPPEDQLSDIENNHTPAAYAYRLLTPKTEKTLVRLWKNWHNEEPPSWAWAAYYADEVYYVGGTSNIYWRVQDHADADRSSQIMCVFPPWKLEIIEPCPNDTAAFEREKQLADELRSENTFVYQA